ncbi:centaurin [Capsaspora owczarzaki ATCC 30864]|uniref:Centaurin n=1 Tax=Capsaspora owczarzaki (strain ATCC 30864) TaxID=595528 RepID=A0A0D2VH97_CAPO3|nr:centaurin [Capsaspora owczarzaki ATCC 30864]KJE89322.1 centaurin [Capsaspora owczarzaki ATCC 30864]|eukprot:XP_004365690.1 centaurin [Capsaspora owczarzaki ATCC 30864]
MEVSLEQGLADTPAYRASLLRAEDTLQDFVTRMRSIVAATNTACDAGTKYSQASTRLADELANFTAEHPGPLAPRKFGGSDSTSTAELGAADQAVVDRVVGSLSNFADTLAGLERYREMLHLQTAAVLAEPIESFVANEVVIRSRHKRHIFEESSRTVEQRQARYAALDRSADRTVVEDHRTQILNAKQDFQQVSLDYAVSINDVIRVRHLRVLQAVLTFMQGQFAFFHQAHDLMKDLQPAMDGLFSFTNELERSYHDDKARQEEERRELSNKVRSAQLEESESGVPPSASCTAAVDPASIIPSGKRGGHNAPPPRVVAATNGRPILQQGFLYKKSKKRKGVWKRCYFLCDGSQLLYQRLVSPQPTSWMSASLSYLQAAASGFRGGGGGGATASGASSNATSATGLATPSSTSNATFSSNPSGASGGEPVQGGTAAGGGISSPFKAGRAGQSATGTLGSTSGATSSASDDASDLGAHVRGFSPLISLAMLQTCMVRAFVGEDAAIDHRSHVFELVSPKRTLLLQAASEEERLAWIAALQQGIATSLGLGTSSHVAAPPANPTPPLTLPPSASSTAAQSTATAADSTGDAALAAASQPGGSASVSLGGSHDLLPQAGDSDDADDVLSGEEDGGPRSPLPLKLVPTLSSAEIETLRQELEHFADNQACADCGAAAPTWASINLGIAVCIECSGIHRKMGVHISKVRSLTLDKWDPALLQMMKSIGNVVSNRVYEASLRSSDNPPASDAGSAATPRKPSPTSSMAEREAFIRAKYEAKLFVAPAAIAGSDSADGLSLEQQLATACVQHDMQAIVRLVAEGADVNAKAAIDEDSQVVASRSKRVSDTSASGSSAPIAAVGSMSSLSEQNEHTDESGATDNEPAATPRSPSPESPRSPSPESPGPVDDALAPLNAQPGLRRVSSQRGTSYSTSSDSSINRSTRVSATPSTDTSSAGLTPLQRIVMNQWMEAAVYLLQHSADPDAGDSYNVSPRLLCQTLALDNLLRIFQVFASAKPPASAASSATATPQSRSDYVYVTGWLKKQGGTIRSWRNRFMILRGNTLFYFKAREDGIFQGDVAPKALGRVKLPTYSIHEAPAETNHAFGFKAMHATQRTYYFIAESAAEMARWMDAMRTASQSAA